MTQCVTYRWDLGEIKLLFSQSRQGFLFCTCVHWFLYSVKTADSISSLGSVVLGLSRWGVVNIFSGNLLYPIKGRLSSKVHFRQRSSPVKGHLLSKVVLCQRSLSIKGRLPSKVVFCQRSSSVKGHLPWKVVFGQRSSSIKGCCPSKVVFILFNLIWFHLFKSYSIWL